MPLSNVTLTFKTVLLSTVLLSTVLLVGACGRPPMVHHQPDKVPVQSEVLEPGVFRPTLTLFGKVEPASRTEIRAPESGTLRYEPRFAGGLRTGAEVRRGEPLFTITSESRRLRLAEAELQLQSAEADLDRARRGVEGGFMAAADLKRSEIAAELAQEQLRSAQSELERLRWTAPRSGVLWVDQVIPGGSEVTSATALAEIAGTGRPRVAAWATTRDLERLENGLTVDCRKPGVKEVVGHGSLSEIARQVDRNGTVRLVVTIEEDLAMPPPGEGLELEVHLAERIAALTLPEEAVVVDGGVASVFVLEPIGAQYKARLRPVRSGNRSGGRIEILGGVRDGERVAVKGTEFLVDGLLAIEAEGD